MAAQGREGMRDVVQNAFRHFLFEIQVLLFVAIGAVERAALGEAVFQKHRAEGGECRATILRIIGGDDACAIVGRVREEHLVDVAVAQEECERIFHVQTVIKTAADGEETACWLEVADASFDAGGQVVVWKQGEERLRIDRSNSTSPSQPARPQFFPTKRG